MKDNVRELETIDFRTLSVFVTTCRLMSLTKCADELGLPKSSVSKSIARLEDHLQAKLLERSTRKMHITDAGQIVYERAANLIEELKSLRGDVQEMEQQVQGTLRVSAPPALGGYLAQEIFPPFLKKWPKAKISLEVSYAFDDLFTKGIDLAIRVGQIADDRLVAKEIGFTTRVLVASPEYIATHGAPTRPEELLNHNCVQFQFESHVSPWILMSGEETLSLDVSSNFYCSSIEAVKRATITGLGIAQVPVNNLACELTKGELVQVLHGWHAVPMPIYLVYRPGVNKPKRVRELLDHILSMEEKFHFDCQHHLCQKPQTPIYSRQTL